MNNTHEFADDSARKILKAQCGKMLQRQVAARLDCTEAQVSKWLSGASMSRGTIHRILAEFDPKYWNKGKSK